MYNLYHPCDPIAYRIEPLVNPKFGDFKAAYVPFESKVGLNGRFEMVSKFTNMISTKLWETSKHVKKKVLLMKMVKMKDHQFSKERLNRNSIETVDIVEFERKIGL